MGSSHQARICYNNRTDDQIKQLVTSNEGKLNILSNEMDLTSVTGVQPARTLFFSNRNPQRNETAELNPNSSTVMDDGTVEQLENTLDPTGFVYSSEDLPNKDL